ncbi:MAG: CehA/McbA family metallohydrolase [Deltaproteobacteria bacterium]|nr:CehA/McbA family metallohydrolase [Deltaproteobacteria bacterium]
MSDFEYVGNLHVHSLYSDGAATVGAIAECAAGAGLDFVGLNDHAYLCRSLHLEEEGLHGGVLVLIGAEIGKRFHHYLAYDLKECVRENDPNPQEVIDEVNRQGGFGFLAHPFEKGMPFLERSVAYTWNDLSVQGFTGICIWNFTSRWKERVKTALHGLSCLAFKAETLQGPSPETLSFWDSLCRSRRVVAIGGSDAHGSTIRWGFLRLTPLTYAHLLGTINIHILLPHALPKEFARAKHEIYRAMREGRLFVAHDGLRSARGFRFSFHAKDMTLLMGEEASFPGEGEIRIELPQPGEIRLIQDGVHLRTWQGRGASFPVVEKGVYRVEAYRGVPFFGLRPWIFSNPIYLR